MKDASHPINKLLNICAILEIIWLALYLTIEFFQKPIVRHLEPMYSGIGPSRPFLSIPAIVGAVLIAGIFFVFWAFMKAHCKRRKGKLVIVGVLAFIGLFVVTPLCRTISFGLTDAIADYKGIYAVRSLATTYRCFAYILPINLAAYVLFTIAFGMLYYRNRYLSEN